MQVARTDQSSLPEVDRTLATRSHGLHCGGAEGVQPGQTRGSGFAGMKGVDLQPRAAINDR